MKLIIINLLLATFTLTGFAQKSANKSAWAPEKIVIDGITNEWTQPFPFSDKNGKFEYFVSNDHDNLYIIIHAFDPSLHQKIMRSGMEIHIGTKAKKKIKATVEYPLGRSPQQGNQMGQRADQSVLRQKHIASNNKMKVTGFQSYNGIIPTINNNGFNAAINWESDYLMSYELSVPLKELYGSAYNEDALSNPIDIKITFKSMAQPQGGRSGGASGGQSGGRSGGGGGGRMSGGAQQGNVSSEMFSPVTAKTKIILIREK